MSKATRDERLRQVYGAESRDDLQRAYDEWAEAYEADVQAFGYLNIAMGAALIGRHVPMREGAVLDAAAGTGMLGEVLYPIGYNDLTALDLSEGMLAEARAKGVYSRLQQAALGGPLDLESDAFAAVAAFGVFTDGHAGADSLDELIRVTRPGGVLIFTVTENVYRESFREAMAAHETAGRWQPVEATPQYNSLPREADAPAAQMFVYRKP